MLKAPVILPDGTKIFPQKGTSQGGILSPLLANIVLNDLDWWITKQWEDHPDIEGLKDPNKWTKLRKKGVREVHIVRYADDFKLFCRTRNDAITLLQDVSEWLMANLHLETSPEKSGVTNLKRNYTEFLGLEIKVRNKNAELSPNASNRQRTWVTTSRIKPKALPRIKAKLESAILPLRNTSDNTAPEAVGCYNSVVDGIQNYYSMATQVSNDLSKLQKDITVQMHNQIKGISRDKPEKIRSQRITDVRFMSSKQTLYLHGCMIHPIGVVQTRICQMPKHEPCSYTAAGRSMLKVKTGVSEFLLTWLARHNPPDMPVEMADNSISAFSAQKGLCAILHIPLAANQAVVTCKDPNKKIRPYRFNNILLISPVANLIICEPNVMLAKQYLSSFKVNKKQRQTINKYRALRNLGAL